MGSFKQAEIDYSGLDNPNCAHYVNPQTKKMILKKAIKCYMQISCY